jgi:predicted ATPase with chaperone activity
MQPHPQMGRQPLEDKQLTIARSAGSLTFPSNFMLIGALNPCPCGSYGDPVKGCTCSNAMVSRYQPNPERVRGISEPVLDRIDAPKQTKTWRFHPVVVFSCTHSSERAWSVQVSDGCAFLARTGDV